jgi:hypothetical protein
MATDPICGMTVEPATAAGMSIMTAGPTIFAAPIASIGFVLRRISM